MLSTVLFWAATVLTMAQPVSLPEQPDGAVICVPGTYISPPEDCLPLGPASIYTRLAAEGLDLADYPLPAFRPDPSLNNIPYLYFKVDSSGVAVYPSLEAATAKQGASRFIAERPTGLRHSSPVVWNR